MASTSLFFINFLSVRNYLSERGESIFHVTQIIYVILFSGGLGLNFMYGQYIMVILGSDMVKSFKLLSGKGATYNLGSIIMILTFSVYTFFGLLFCYNWYICICGLFPELFFVGFLQNFILYICIIDIYITHSFIGMICSL